MAMQVNERAIRHGCGIPLQKIQRDKLIVSRGGATGIMPTLKKNRRTISRYGMKRIWPSRWIWGGVTGGDLRINVCAWRDRSANVPK
jgi:hypothetical protein